MDIYDLISPIIVYGSYPPLFFENQNDRVQLKKELRFTND